MGAGNEDSSIFMENMIQPIAIAISLGHQHGTAYIVMYREQVLWRVKTHKACQFIC